MRLLLNFCIERPLIEKEQLDALQKLIYSYLPNWAMSFSVAKDEDSPNVYKVVPEEGLYLAASKAAPVKFGLSSMVISGSYADLLFFADGSRSTLPPELNQFSVEVVNRETVEGWPIAQWARDFFLAVPENLPVRYANGYSGDEFDAKNMIRTKKVEKAIGVQLDKALPGLNWLNYFGTPYLKLIGKERLLSSPAYEVQAVADGVFIRLSDSPNEWNKPEYRERERQVIAHLGEKFFFSKDEPEKETTAPDFRPRS